MPSRGLVLRSWLFVFEWVLKFMGVVTALEIQKQNKERVNVYLDGEFAFSLSLIEAAGLRKGQILSEAEIAALRDEDAILKAVDSAARFLAYRPRSIQEVRRNLAEKSIPQAVIETALNRLNAMGYLDDQAFARYWVENRTMFKPLGPAALRYELRKKGVAQATIDDVLAEMVDADEAAYQAACSQKRKLHGTNRRDFRHKLFGFLQRRGFGNSAARGAIERLIEELDSDDPDYFQPGEDTPDL